jgi:hypothetical protein
VKIQDLVESCVKSINTTVSPFTPMISIEMPSSKKEANTRFLFPKGGKTPVGTVVCRYEKCDVVNFKAVEVLAWLVANGAVKMEDIGCKDQETLPKAE